jgi:ribonuclease HII
MERRVIGIDEAGRGPVIGSLFVAGVVNFDGLESLGVKDSKRLSPSRREYLAKCIEEATDFHVVEMTAREIDEKRATHTLNEVMVDLFSEVITHFQPDRAIVDSAEVNPERFASHLKSNYRGVNELEIISECKADDRYPVVSAASIVAKVHRDRSIRELEAEIGTKIGSGYPADVKTVQFLKEVLKDKEMCDIPSYIRRSWRTVHLYMPKG